MNSPQEQSGQHVPPTRPDWVTKGAIVRHEYPQTKHQTRFVLHKLQQLRGTDTVYLLPNETGDRYPLTECRAASWADFAMLQTLQVRNETWSITHPRLQLAEAQPGNSQSWLVLSESYIAALELSDYFDGDVLLPPGESLDRAAEQLTAQWAEPETS